MAPKIDLSKSQRALAEVLQENGDQAERLRTECPPGNDKPIHRTKLWMYSTGRGRPSVETAAFIEQVTEQRVPANGWVSDAHDVEGDAA